MSLSTYAELKTSIADWIGRKDLTDQIPDFISKTEKKIFHDYRSRIPPLEKRVVLTVDDEGYAGIPSDYLEGIAVLCNDVPLSRIDLSQLQSYKTRSGTPAYFARERYMFKLFPMPESGSQVEVIYYHQPDDLSDTNTTNIMFEQAPSLYLDGSLVEASKYLDSNGSRWEESFQTTMNKLLEHSRGAEFSGSVPQMANGYV